MIYNPVIVGGGAKLPELTNPGTAADLLSPKQLIDAEGNALTGTMVTKTASDLTASGATVTAPAGYYASAASKSIATATQATPAITVSSAGLITASATQTAGYVAAGTKSATKQLTTKAAATITPGTANQTIASGQYLTGTQTIKGDANLLAENIKSGVSIFGVAGSYEGDTPQIYSSSSKSVTRGTLDSGVLTLNRVDQSGHSTFLGGVYACCSSSTRAYCVLGIYRTSENSYEIIYFTAYSTSLVSVSTCSATLTSTTSLAWTFSVPGLDDVSESYTGENFFVAV